MTSEEQLTLQKVDEAYDSPSWWYDVRGFFILTLSYRDTLWHQVGFFEKNISPNHLEVAIGSGSLLGIILNWRRLLRRQEGTIHGFDYADRMLDGARKRFKNNPAVSVFRADAGALDFPDNTFDSINIANAFHCFPEPEKCMRELFRVLKPGKDLAVNVVLYPPGQGIMAGIANKIANWGMKKGILYKPYHVDEALNMFRACGFECASYYTRGYSLNAILRKPA